MAYFATPVDRSKHADDDASFRSLQFCQYPKHNLSSRALKNALVELLVRPHVFSLERRVLAFRIMWRVQAEELEAAWRGIVGYRRRSDDIVRRCRSKSDRPDVGFFVSAVSGVFTKDKGRLESGERPRVIYPAISYWVVLSADADTDAAAGCLFRLLRESNPAATIKYIVTVRSASVQQSLESVAAPLFVTLKDHNDSFTQRKVQSSAQHLGLRDAIIAKLVVVDVAGCGRPLFDVWTGLCAQKLLLEFDISPPDGDTADLSARDKN